MMEGERRRKQRWGKGGREIQDGEEDKEERKRLRSEGEENVGRTEGKIGEKKQDSRREWR